MKALQRKISFNKSQFQCNHITQICAHVLSPISCVIFHSSPNKNPSKLNFPLHTQSSIFNDYSILFKTPSVLFHKVHIQHTSPKCIDIHCTAKNSELFYSGKSCRQKSTTWGWGGGDGRRGERGRLFSFGGPSMTR